MAELLKKPQNSAQDADEARRAAEGHRRKPPAGSKPDENPDSERSGVPLGKQIRAQINHPHKGDVGRPGTNEEVFQGSKEKELQAG